MSRTVLVLGASGRFGRHAAHAISHAGWTVRRFRRGTDLSAAAAGADLIVNGWDTPHRLDGERLSALAPTLASTPVETAMRMAFGLQVDPDESVV